MDSGYPTSEVVKTASPLILALAPKLFPWKTGPSRIVNVARSKDGFVAREDTGGGGERGVPATTVALYRTWMVGLKALEKAVEGLKERVKIADAMVGDCCFNVEHGGPSVHRGFPEVVGDVVCACWLAVGRISRSAGVICCSVAEERWSGGGCVMDGSGRTLRGEGGRESHKDSVGVTEGRCFGEDDAPVQVQGSFSFNGAAMGVRSSWSGLRLPLDEFSAEKPAPSVTCSRHLDKTLPYCFFVLRVSSLGVFS